jgi:cation:H+ antiporter
LFWGLQLDAGKKTKRTASAKSGAAATETQQINRLSLLLTLVAVLFFSGVTWAVGADGELGRSDGLVLVALFLFWQSFQVFDVLKHNVRRRQTFGIRFYLDLFVVLLGAYGLYVSIDWLMAWLPTQEGRFVNAGHLGWLSGWLMVLPNALLAFFFAARRRADVVFASQVGDGHICIPLCLGLSAIIQPLPLPTFFEIGIMILAGAAVVHAACLAISNGLPRWMGWPLIGAYTWFVAAGLAK